MSENISVAVIGLDAEVEGIGAVPLVVDRFDEMRHVAQPELYRPLVRFMTRIGFNTKFHTVILTLVAIGRELSAVIDRRYIFIRLFRGARRIDIAWPIRSCPQTRLHRVIRNARTTP
jgi:hypothetical protein